MILGLRCSPDQFAFVIVEGDSESCKVVKSGVKRFPADLSRPGFLNWISKEIKSFLAAHPITAAVYKEAEFSQNVNRGSLKRRAEVEGVIQAVLYENGCQDVDGLLKKQIKTITSYSGTTSDVAEVLSTTDLKDHVGKPTEEAALVAFARLIERGK